MTARSSIRQFVMRSNDPPNLAICIRNDGYPAALEPRKVYRILDDAEAGRRGMVRVIDESGEDYLYPIEWFVPIALPESALGVFQIAG